MGQNSKIEWTHHTFNPWTGCAKVSPGCTRCYAESWAKRSGLVIWGQDGTRRVTSDSNWKQPFKWARDAEREGVKKRVFCASLADVFEDRTELIEPRERLWGVIYDTAKHLDWLLLTKRPENINGMTWNHIAKLCWIGTTAENQEYADKRIPHLLATPAAVRFLSVEPMLGAVDARRWLQIGEAEVITEGLLLPKTQIRRSLHWVIVGGESGPGARPMHPDWARSMRDQCAAAGVPFYFKQHGEWVVASDENGISGSMMPEDGERFTWLGFDGKTQNPSSHGLADPVYAMAHVGKKAAGRLLDGREWNEFPEGQLNA